MNDPVSKYFATLPASQQDKLKRLEALYKEWNPRVNLVSRKDMDNFVLHHIIHSLSIYRLIPFLPGTKILDAGTGGGLPGIPLAIVFPECSFTLADSVRKKINIVKEIKQELELDNIEAMWTRVEEMEGSFDFVISRAVAAFPLLVKWTGRLVRRPSANDLPNGIMALKGGDLSSELAGFKHHRMWRLEDYFDEEYFRGKKIVYLPV
ncbi:MAG: 16S rRNA (guanine(527)-N(7))-methyltransferase RsmG [Bacteroidales bacterium]|nr:16S rRNA (guanine(527)-N(7))-methyltransferase RsmG [Bacteroidales bacterium]